jgi:hypothetical protein
VGYNNAKSRVAAGTINPFTFIQSGAMVASDSANGFTGGQLTALQCTGSGVEIIGIGAEWTNAMAGANNQSPYSLPAATIGQGIRVYEDGEDTIVMVGSGYNVMWDQLLTSDASGNAIPANVSTASTQWIGARAIEAGIAGDVIRVSVYTRGPYKAT